MTIDDLKTASATAKRGLKAAGWTLESIATSTAPKMVKVRGVSIKSAGQIIEEARELVNAQGLEEAEEPSYPAAPSVDVEIQMSPRVRRAVMSSDQGWNK